MYNVPRTRVAGNFVGFLGAAVAGGRAASCTCTCGRRGSIWAHDHLLEAPLSQRSAPPSIARLRQMIWVDVPPPKTRTMPAPYSLTAAAVSNGLVAAGKGGLVDFFNARDGYRLSDIPW